jgi:hypothetical protein
MHNNEQTEENVDVIYVVKSSADDEFFSATPPGIHADPHGNLMCRIFSPLFCVHSADGTLKVLEGEMVGIVGPFVDIMFKRDVFAQLAESGYFLHANQYIATAMLEHIKRAEDGAV